MENNDIINRLLENGLTKKDQSESNLTMQSDAQQTIDRSLQQWDKVEISKLRVTTAKYRLYIIILFIIIVAFLFKMNDIEESHTNVIKDYTNAQNKQDEVEWLLKGANDNISFLKEIVSNEQNVVGCLNGDPRSCNQLPDSWKSCNDESLISECLSWYSKTCDNLPSSWSSCNDQQQINECLTHKTKEVCDTLFDNWKSCENKTCENTSYNLSVPVSFLQLHSLYNVKMDVDEKKILKNLDNYLIRTSMQNNTRTKVGDILKINIWNSEVVTKCTQHLGQLWTSSIVKDCSDSFFMVPVNVTIDFSTIWDLTWFLYNVEKKMIDDWEDRILYKIQSVSYDILANEESQTTDIEMIAYYYYDKNIKEDINILEENDSMWLNEDIEHDNIEHDNTKNSDWSI